ncbi:MAG: V-type ATP synthase subunit D [Eubacteriales bacterium]|jgi:V/A-type H+-transporting ATPase subunit D
MDTSTFPTKGNLMKAKRSLDLADLGYELMDRKRNILIREMMALIEDAKEVQSRIDDTFAAAYRALQGANISLGICSDVANAVPIDDNIQIMYRSVMGVEIPLVSTEEQPSGTVPYGFIDTNSLLDQAYFNFTEVKRLTLKLAQIENSIYRLAHAVSKVQKRANALKNIIIPRTTLLVAQITEALEEKDREEFSRLKVIKHTKTGES